MKQLKPNSEVTKALAPIIRNSSEVWKNLPNGGVSLDAVKALEVPEEDKEKALDIMYNMDGGEHLDKATELLGNQSSTNCIAYPPNSSMGWHTNSNREGVRTYYSFTVKPGRFIYLHPETGQMIVDSDQVGWTVRQFEISKDKPLWHCVWADGVRFSFGFTRPIEEAN
tara:strand:- start:322 stop:825 length:504 start_codon:yes stop_codon:yes gene_type:complete